MSKETERHFGPKQPMVTRILFVAFLLFLSSACARGGEGQAVITGKTVYRGMAIEDVRVRVLRLDGGNWKESASGRSGYHGSFQVRTEPGTIRLEARGEIIAAGRRIPLEGRVDSKKIAPGVRRVDRIVIELARADGRPWK